jgi:hypothetical protein
MRFLHSGQVELSVVPKLVRMECSFCSGHQAATWTSASIKKQLSANRDGTYSSSVADKRCQPSASFRGSFRIDALPRHPAGQFDCGRLPGWNMEGSGRILWMARDCWVENLRCPNCRKAGAAQLSAADEYSWEIQVDSVPEGFKVIQSHGGSNFCCSACNSPVEP